MTTVSQTNSTTKIEAGDTVTFCLPRYTAQGKVMQPYTGIVQEAGENGIDILVPGVMRTWVPTGAPVKVVKVVQP